MEVGVSGLPGLVRGAIHHGTRFFVVDDLLFNRIPFHCCVLSRRAIFPRWQTVALR